MTSSGTILHSPCCHAPSTKYDADSEYSEEENQLLVQPMKLVNLPNKDIEFASSAGQLKTNFIVFDHFTRDHVLEEEELDYTGNESQGKETVYMVAGLQVREKSAKVVV